MPQNQSQRNLIAKMKLIPVDTLIRDKSLLLIDDSIVRGTQLGETTEFLYQSGEMCIRDRSAGVSEYTVILSKSPFVRRTHFPSFISIAGYNCMTFHPRLSVRVHLW